MKLKLKLKLELELKPEPEPELKQEQCMNEETFNLSIRKFLKTVGVGSQREIERAVDEARARGSLSGNESFPVQVRLEIAGLNLSVKFDGTIDLG